MYLALNYNADNCREAVSLSNVALLSPNLTELNETNCSRPDMENIHAERAPYAHVSDTAPL